MNNYHDEIKRLTSSMINNMSIVDDRTLFSIGSLDNRLPSTLQVNIEKVNWNDKDDLGRPRITFRVYDVTYGNNGEVRLSLDMNHEYSTYYRENLSYDLWTLSSFLVSENSTNNLNIDIDKLIKAIKVATKGSFISTYGVSRTYIDWEPEYDENGNQINEDPNYVSSSILINNVRYYLTVHGKFAYIMKNEDPNHEFSSNNVICMVDIIEDRKVLTNDNDDNNKSICRVIEINGDTLLKGAVSYKENDEPIGVTILIVIPPPLRDSIDPSLKYKCWLVMENENVARLTKFEEIRNEG